MMSKMSDIDDKVMFVRGLITKKIISPKVAEALIAIAIAEDKNRKKGGELKINDIVLRDISNAIK